MVCVCLLGCAGADATAAGAGVAAAFTSGFGCFVSDAVGRCLTSWRELLLLLAACLFPSVYLLVVD